MTMLIGVGTDLVKLARIFPTGMRTDDAFLRRAFTEKERAEVEKRGNEQQLHYAARFAGKEAVYKAISVCGAAFCPHEIEITTDAEGRPGAALLGNTKHIFEGFASGAYSIQLSLSYDTDMAVAFAVAERPPSI